MAIIRTKQRLREIMFLNERLVDLFLIIRNGPLSWSAKECKLNYAYTLKLLEIWEGMGLVKKNKVGFRYNIIYTEKGEKLFDYLGAIRSYMKRCDIQWTR